VGSAKLSDSLLACGGCGESSICFSLFVSICEIRVYFSLPLISVLIRVFPWLNIVFFFLLFFAPLASQR
jgi:hypothetical protein